jgi:hypothetical protein
MRRTPDELKNLPPYDVCIVGSGPSGMTLCAELATSGLSILVIESGGEYTSQATDTLRKVVASGIIIRENSRERVLGGASETWGGMSAPLDPIDFEHRSYASSHEGWPITARELVPYLTRAGRRYRFALPEDFAPDTFLSPEEKEEVAWKTLVPKVFLAVRPAFQFGKELQYLFAHPHIDLVTGVTITQINENPEQKGSVSSAHCRGFSGEDVLVHANVFVLATGALENARLLLTSKLGNEHDQVGRYLMNHPKGYRGSITLAKDFPLHSEYFWKKEHGYAGYIGLRLSEDVQRKERVLNSYVRLEAGFPWTGRAEMKIVGAYIAHAKSLARALVKGQGSVTKEAGILLTSLPQYLSALPGYIGLLIKRLTSLSKQPTRLLPRYFLEMEPRAENRVTLGSELDAFGMPIANVHHEPSELDIRSYHALQDALGKEFEEAGIGTLIKNEEVPNEDASHHLGATRMGVDPKTSVVTPDLRVHSLENLYIAGGSVFPTSGCANPTLMMSALSVRLAEHLRSNVFGISEKKVTESSASPVIVIGAGERVRTDILPVLESLPESFRIHKIVGRSRRALFGKERVYEVEPLETLTQEDIAMAKVLYLSVPAGEVGAVLEFLRSHDCSHIDLILPTPISPELVIPAGRCKRVVVEEDMPYLPWIPAYKRASRKTLGALQEIVIDRSAYKYHAIALIKALCGSSSISNVRSVFSRGRQFLCGSVRAVLIEPRDYSSGHLKLVSVHGVITENDIDCTRNESGFCTRFRVDGEEEPLAPEESALFGKLIEGDTIVTRMHDCKRVGLRRLLVELASSPTTPWSLEEGKSDTALSS